VYGIELARQHAGERKLSGPLHLDIVFYLPINTAHCRRKKNPLPPEINNERLHVFRPDLDNYLKFILDAMNDTQTIFQDDCQVARITAKKILGNPSRTELTLSEIR